MALAALCRDDEWGNTWSKVVQHRFGGDQELAGHAVGNLLIVALWDLLGDTVAGLDWVGRLLGTGGRVLPMAAVPLDIVAEVVGADPARPDEVTTVRGQAKCAITPGQVRSITLLPPDPPAVPEAVRAVLDADWVVFGPGSWFTSVLPHLLVPELAAALRVTTARRVVVLNLVPQPGETGGFSPPKHLEVLAGHAPALTVDVVLADTKAAGTGSLADLEKAASMLGARLVVADVAAADGTPRHDPKLLAGAYAQIFQGGSGQGSRRGGPGERFPPGTRGVWGGRPPGQHRGSDANGDDRRGEGRAQPGTGDQVVLPEGRGLHAAQIRRRTAPGRRPGGDRGRTGHRRGRPAAAGQHLRGVRAPGGVPGARTERPAQGQPLPGPGGQGPVRRDPGPPGRADRQLRPPGARPAQAGGVRRHLRLRGGLARRLPRPRLTDRTWPVDGPRDHLPGL